ILDLLNRAVERSQRYQHDEPFQHAHAYAGQVVRKLLEHDHAEPGKGGAFTLHGGFSPAQLAPALLQNSAYRSLRGSAPARSDILSDPACPPPRPRLPAVRPDRPEGGAC